MVHNGIEYGDMQLIAEAYDILRKALRLEAAELADIFDEWNRGPLESFLIEITANIFRRRDEETARLWLASSVVHFPCLLLWLVENEVSQSLACLFVSTPEDVRGDLDQE